MRPLVPPLFAIVLIYDIHGVWSGGLWLSAVMPWNHTPKMCHRHVFTILLIVNILTSVDLVSDMLQP